MKKSKFTEEQILFALKQGTPGNRLQMSAAALRWRRQQLRCKPCRRAGTLSV